MAGIDKPSLAIDLTSLSCDMVRTVLSNLDMAAPRTHNSGQAKPAATAPIRRLHNFLLFFLWKYA
jgi:hypothetical protein